MVFPPLPGQRVKFIFMITAITGYMLLCIPQFLVFPGWFENPVEAPRVFIISIGVYLLWRKGTNIAGNFVLVPLCVFFIINFISMLGAADRWVALAGYYEAPYYGFFPLTMISMAYLSAGKIENPHNIIAWTGALLGVVAVVQASTGETLWGGLLPQGRAVGFRGSPVFFGASLIPAFLVGWSIARKERTGKYIIPVCLAFCGMIAAGAKGALLASLAGVWAMEARGKARWTGLLVIVAALFVYLQFPIGNNPERMELIKISWLAFWDRPWFGWGPDNFILAFGRHITPEYVRIVGESLGQASAHNAVAQVAATLGITGLLAYAWLLLSMVRASTTRLSMALLIGAFIQSLVNPIPIDVMIIFAVLLGTEHGDAFFIHQQEGA